VATTRTVRTIASREDGWWFVDMPEISTATQARTVAEIEPMAVECVALYLDVPEESIELDLEIRLPGDAAARWASAQFKADQAHDDESEATAEARSVVSTLHDSGMPYTDIAKVLGLSTRQVNRIAHTSAA
jgi:DNA-directed RNA polymerase specialized sigma24 family protein